MSEQNLTPMLSLTPEAPDPAPAAQPPIQENPRPPSSRPPLVWTTAS